MNTLEYKGYVGSIEVSEEDGCLYGKVLSLPGNILVSYEGANLDELQEDFRATIDARVEYGVAQNGKAMF